MLNKRLLLAVFCIACVTGCYGPKKEYESDIQPYKILRKEPIQEKIELEKFNINDEIILTPIYDYKIAARVLRVEKYTFDKMSSISPYDLALGWGQMSYEEKIKKAKVKISQGNRFYFWEMPPEGINVLSVDEVSMGSANTHIIPANKQIKDYIAKNVKEGDSIYMEGYLVNAYHQKDNGTWSTSKVRTDTGAGSCEILYVTKIKHLLNVD